MSLIRHTPLRRKTPLRAKAVGGRRKRSKSLSTYKRELWKIFSEYIRRRDADHAGMVKCVSCPTVKHWKQMDCGHYLPKSLGLSIYFEERNCAAQCQRCNLSLQGNQYPYALHLLSKYGLAILEELKALQRVPRKISKAEYQDLIAEYQQKLKRLDKLPEAA